MCYVPRRSQNDAEHSCVSLTVQRGRYPQDKTLRDVRAGVEMGGYRFPAALRIMARTNPNLHIFEYRGETLYTHEAHGLMEATTEVEADPLLES